MSKIIDLSANTKFFKELIFIKPFGLSLVEGQTLVSLTYTPEERKVEFGIAEPGGFVSQALKIKDRAKVEGFERLTNAIDIANKASHGYAIEFAETVIIRNLDALTSGMLTVVPAMDIKTLEELDMDTTITGYRPNLIQQYAEDGVTCSRGVFDLVRIEIGEPVGLKVPYTYFAVVAGDKLAFNAAITVDHNVYLRDEDNNLLEPIATGSTHFATNGFATIKRVMRDSCEAVVINSDGEVCTYDLIGKK